MSDTRHTVTAVADSGRGYLDFGIRIECHGDLADGRRSCRMVDDVCAAASMDSEALCPEHGGTVDRCPAIVVDGEACAARHYVEAGGLEAIRWTDVEVRPLPFDAIVWWDGEDFPTLTPVPEETPCP